MKKLKIFALVGSIFATLAATGGTIAYFAIKEQKRTDIGTGKVEVASRILGDTFTGSSKGFLCYRNVSEYDTKVEFHNGGKATLRGSSNYETTQSILIERMTPGDRIDFKIEVKDTSTIWADYRFNIVNLGTDDTLIEQLSFPTYVSKWTRTIEKDNYNRTYTHDFFIELPSTVTSEVGDKAIQLAIELDAVQKNEAYSETEQPLELNEDITTNLGNHGLFLRPKKFFGQSYFDIYSNVELTKGYIYCQNLYDGLSMNFHAALICLREGSALKLNHTNITFNFHGYLPMFVLEVGSKLVITEGSYCQTSYDGTYNYDSYFEFPFLEEEAGSDAEYLKELFAQCIEVIGGRFYNFDPANFTLISYWGYTRDDTVYSVVPEGYITELRYDGYYYVIKAPEVPIEPEVSEDNI